MNIGEVLRDLPDGSHVTFRREGQWLKISYLYDGAWADLKVDMDLIMVHPDPGRFMAEELTLAMETRDEFVRQNERPSRS